MKDGEEGATPGKEKEVVEDVFSGLKKCPKSSGLNVKRGEKKESRVWGGRHEIGEKGKASRGQQMNVGEPRSPPRAWPGGGSSFVQNSGHSLGEGGKARARGEGEYIAC